ncbi:hypothetical protein [Novosphingobium sp. ERN07]|nr:hypothetical protein [Novosphingobium sp. ERN07]
MGNYAPHGPAIPRVMDNARGFNAELACRDMVVRHWPSAYGVQDADAWK